MLIRWISCHHPTRQLLHTSLEIKCWAWALVAAEKCDASLAGESILPELLLFIFASQEKGRSLAVVSLCTPGCQESPSSCYPGTFFVCFQGNWGTSKLSILFTFHWELKVVLAFQSHASTLAMDHPYLTQGSSQTCGYHLLRTTSIHTLLQRAYSFAPPAFPHVLKSRWLLVTGHDFPHSLKLNEAKNNKVLWATRSQCNLEVIAHSAEYEVHIWITFLVW